MRYILIFLLFPLFCQGQIFTSYTSAAYDPCEGQTSIDWDEADGSGPYDIIAIGSQCWFKRNLNVGTRINANTNQTNNSTREKYCYSDLESNCDVYGGLYQWDEAVAYENSDFWEGAQGLCPSGWHIPTETEVETLVTYVGYDGGKLKETGTTHWCIPNIGATNSTGFTMLPSGYFISQTGEYAGLTSLGEFWTSTYYYVIDRMRSFKLDTKSTTVGYGSPFLSWGLAIRCIKN